MRTFFTIALLLIPASAFGEITSFPIKPSATDPAIKTFDDPHWLYVNRGIVVERKPELPKDRHQLLLWLTGTGGKGQTAMGFSNLAADLGYHVVTLMFPDDVPATTCATDADPKAFENFRMAIIAGGKARSHGGTKDFPIERAESIESRLIKLLEHLKTIRPAEHWEQFLNDDGTIKWESITVAGQSQGGGHAALIGIRHKVARVIAFGAPKDYSKKLDAPAAWYAHESATPKNRFYAFNHHQDPKGCTPEQLLKNLKALGLDAFGAVAEVDTEAAPFHHSHVLYTGFPNVTIDGPESDGAKAAHTSGISTKNAERWKPVWTYLLTDEGEREAK